MGSTRQDSAIRAPVISSAWPVKASTDDRLDSLESRSFWPISDVLNPSQPKAEYGDPQKQHGDEDPLHKTVPGAGGRGHEEDQQGKPSKPVTIE